MTRCLTRRSFVQRATAAAAGAGLLGVPSLPRLSPQEKLNIAFVGVGNKGWDNVQQLAAHNIVALCDVDLDLLNAASAAFPQAKTFRDYRKMLDEVQGQIDAVVVSTPDHSHAPATAAALMLGKHVYCEKPLTHTVAEARVITELATRHRCVTQMGTQIHAGENYRRVVEWVTSGRLGKIRRVYTWCNKGWGDGRFSDPVPAPANLDWDLWLGPAAERPYSTGIHPANWRRFWAYGCGTFGDMACHVMDLPFWALGLRYPRSVRCEGPERHDVGTPAWARATYEFETEFGPLTLHWADGGAKFDEMEQTVDHDGQPLSSWGLGILFVGDQGSLVADYGRRQLLPRDKFEGVDPPAETLPASVGHWKEWADACKEGGKTTCAFDYSGPLTEAVLLGIAAYRCGETLEWNGLERRVTNTRAADPWLAKSYRSGWTVPGAEL